MKQRLTKIAVLFFALMIVFTILSRAAYNLTTPRVVLGKVESMEIGPEISGSGVVEAKTEIPIIVTAQQLIKSVRVMAGQEVKEGDILFELDQEQLQKSVKLKEWELNSIRQQIESAQEAKKALDQVNLPQAEDYSAAQMEMEKETKEEELKQLKALADKEGKILSPTSGVVSEVNVKPGTMTSGMGDILVFSATEGLVLKARFSQDQKEYLVRGAKVSVSSQMFTESELEKLGELKINTVSQSVEGMDVEVAIFLESDVIPIGTNLSLQIQTEKKSYHDCLPLSALHQEEEGKYFVYVLDEKETILGDEKIARKVDVEVEYQGALYVAVTNISEEQQVILTSTKEITDGGRIKPQEQ